ncbi:MAG: phage baseplate assembly protein V [Candidatus Fibromonas sp.]|jgi:uncharacterized protein involved in type VI secretion and phage assembly|nr:phage baseplate assembly protein V [Candidatus Fibromonas sp.]
MSDSSLFNLSVGGLKPAVLSFELLEGVSGDDYLKVGFLASSGCSESLIGQEANFSFDREFFNGTVTECSEEQSGTGFSRFALCVKTLRHSLDREKKCAVYCDTDAETIIRSLGISAKLNSFYEVDFKIQYNESDMDFLQRLLEDFKIIEFVRHSEGSSELVISDGDAFEERELNLVKCRLQAEEGGNFLFGYGHSSLRPGMAFNAFGETFIVCSAFHNGSQEAAFGLKDKVDGYTCQIAAFSKRMLRKLPHGKIKPQVPGVIVAKTEGFAGSFASLDNKGCYTVRMPFDGENHNSALAKHPVHLAQNFAGEDFGVHFPLKKDTPVLIAFEDGDIDRPVALGALPREKCKSPVAKNNSHQNILKTSSGIKFLFDDSTGNLDIEAPANLSIKAGGRLTLQGKMVEIN